MSTQSFKKGQHSRGRREGSGHNGSGQGAGEVLDFQAAGICGAIEKMDPCNHKSHRSLGLAPYYCLPKLVEIGVVKSTCDSLAKLDALLFLNKGNH